MMKKYILCAWMMVCMGGLSAQTLNQAKKHFESGDYEKARKEFAVLIKRSPASAEVNYYLGASLYETGELEKALPYLEKSAKRKYIGAFRYLGKAYADMYRFEEAVENQETYIGWLEEKKRDTELAETELADLRNKARMFKSVEKVMVVDSMVMDKEKFLEAYKISHTPGKLLMNEAGNGTIHENEMGDKRMVSEMTDGRMKLFMQTKLIDGWSEKEPVELPFETGHANYPFLMGDGTTLYFASDGEGSIGGYDIFVTRYDSEDKTFLKPSNIGMPFNSPANDYLYVIDEFYNLGWFVTDRNQEEGKVCAYIFVPNESKQTYNYEATDPKVIMDAATLRDIKITWTDEEALRKARQQMATIKYADAETEAKKEFHFVIDDSATYTTLADFKSIEARTTFEELLHKQRDLEQLKGILQQKRNEFEQENGLGKKKLEPSILSLEERIPKLMEEVEKLILDVRCLEVQTLRK